MIPKQEYFRDGITEEIITALSKVPLLFVIARQLHIHLQGKPVKVKQVSEELGVRYVLEGSVRKAGGKVRITAQLIDALTGHHLWAERYDRDLKEIFALQDEITMKIITAIQVKLTAGRTSATIAQRHEKPRSFYKVPAVSLQISPGIRKRELLGPEVGRGDHCPGFEVPQAICRLSPNIYAGYLARDHGIPRTVYG